MKPILYEAGETAFTTNGLGRLADALACIVTEERNGAYELEMTYPVLGIHYGDLKEERLIYVPHDDTGTRQPFEIYKITRPMDGIVTVYAKHISYQLSKIAVRPFTAQTIAETMQALQTNAVDACPFTFWTDKTTTGRFTLEVPQSIRSTLGGKEGSILDVYGTGEYEWDHRTVKLHAARGTNSGVTIRYRKNLEDIRKTTDMEEVWTGVCPFWKGTDNNQETVVTIDEGAVYASGAMQTSYRMVVVVDFSSNFESKPTKAQLKAAAQAYANANAKSGIPTSIDISFVQLWQTEEYKDVAPLQRLSLCDTASVYHEGLDISVTAKVVKVSYDVLQERYTSMTLGDTRGTLAKAVAGIGSQMSSIKKALETETKTAIQAAVDRATNLIRGGLGGNVVINTDANGKPIEILIMDTADTSTAVNVIRINMNGIGFSTSGYNGPFRSAWTIDGHFVADFIDTGTLSAALIQTGTMSANRILGGTMKLGGSGNGNGKLEIYDANGNLIGKLDNTGANLTGNIVLNASTFFAQVGNSHAYIFVNNFTGFDWDAPYALNMYKKNSSGKVTSLCVFAESSAGSNFQESVVTNKSAFYRAVTFTQDSDINSDSAVAVSKRFLESFDSDGWGLRHWESSDTDYRVNLKNHRLQIYSDDKTAYIDLSGQSGYGKFEIMAEDFGLRMNNYGVQYTVNGGSSWATLGSSSSMRYKHDIDILMDEELDSHKLYDLPVRQFVYNEEAPLQYPDMEGEVLPGFIAEEVAEIYPSAVIRHAKTGEIESWDERRIIPGMLALIQEQHKKIESLEKRIADIESVLNKMSFTEG